MAWEKLNADFVSVDTERQSIEEQPTGPEGSYVGEHGGIQAAVAPNLTAYEHNADALKEVQYQSGTTYYATDQISTGGVYKSTDQGSSWTQTGSLGQAIHVLFKSENSGTLIAVGDDNTVHRSTDDGGTWTQVHTMDYSCTYAGYTVTPSGNILIGEYPFFSSGTSNVEFELYQSTDDGQTWSTVLTSTATQAGSGHHHCVSYDSVADKTITLQDYGAGPEIYETTDEGDTWSQIGKVDFDKGPNFVEPMFFTNYIAWGYDLAAENGWISRLPRSDFYSGNWQGNVERVAKANDKMGYYTHQISTDTWLAGFANETDEHPGAYSSEVYVVYDDGARLSGGFEHLFPAATIGSTKGAKVRFPMLEPGTDAGSNSFACLTSTNQPRPKSSVPISLGQRNDMQLITPGSAYGFTMPHRAALQSRDSTGSVQKLLYYDGRTIFQNPQSSGAQLRAYQNSWISVTHSGSLSFSVKPSVIDFEASEIRGLATTTNTPADASTPATYEEVLGDDGNTYYRPLYQ